MFKGEKTRVFWWGLIIFGLALVGLFTFLWYLFVLNYAYYSDWRYYVPYIFGCVVFLLIGLFMMISGVKKEVKSQSQA
jgi:putative Mn2+ efflux pump MntP